MKIRNKPMFWTGLIFQIIQLTGIVIFGLTLLSWDWVTQRIIISALGILAVILYNGISVLMIYLGVREDKTKKKK